jgi:asparagine synthetase B (glutamine-hydrolysing)
VQWLREDELGQFDTCFERAVQRCLGEAPAAIFLSGGFDSVSVAALATDRLRKDGRRPLHALSLGFPEPDDGESFVQRSVANALELTQDFVAFDDAVGRRGLVPPALELSASWPAPLVNLWAPAYQHLGRFAAARGCGAILTGTGGDEWLNVSPYLAADLIRQGDMRRLIQLIRIFQRSFEFGRFEVARSILWNFGLRPLLSAGIDVVAHHAWQTRRTDKLIQSTPEWLAPDPALRRLMDERAHASLRPSRPPHGRSFYEQQMHAALDHPLFALDSDERFEFGRRLGVQMVHPYLDPDLVGLLYRTPPRLLTRNGRTKALVRDAVARRFPTLGFERQRKTDATGFYRKLLQREGRASWRAATGLPALTGLGIVAPQSASNEMEALLSGQRPEQSHRIWDFLNLEAWVAAHQ